MMVKKVFIILLLGFLAACSSTANKPTPTVVDKGSGGDSSTSDAGTTSARSFVTGTDNGSNMTELNDPQGPFSVRIIYFEFDSSDIRPQFRDTVEAHATYLIANPEVVLSLEGHADERGSREYNLALGEGRSQTVKRQMVLLGASASQIRTTSYGEERPVSEEHDEFAWSQNRRVEIIY